MIRQSFQIDVEMKDDLSGATVSIGILHDIGTKAMMACSMVATENMMTAFAANSALGFEEALAKLCEGARTNKIEMLGGVRQQ